MPWNMGAVFGDFLLNLLKIGSMMCDLYIHQPQCYLSIEPQGIGAKRDAIEVPINHLIDTSCLKITKACRLFRKSNPPFLEKRGNIIYIVDTHQS